MVLCCILFLEVIMKLIINADDLGFSKGINYGIYDAYKNGIITSTTIMMNMSATEHAIELLNGTGIGIGVHMNVTAGKALLDHQYITDEDGFFSKELIENINDDILAEIEKEFTAQIEMALQKNIEISHLDSHHHVHMWCKELFEMSSSLAKHYGVAIRCDRGYEFMTEKLWSKIKSTQFFDASFFDKTAYIGFLVQILQGHKSSESLELMVHPGFLDGTLIHRDSYREMRMVEHSILTSAFIKELIKSEEIELINYHQL